VLWNTEIFRLGQHSEKTGERAGIFVPVFVRQSLADLTYRGV
jgi:hypothetical protein